AIGAIGLVCILLLKLSLFLSIPKEILWRSLILMCLFSRWVQVLVCYISKYARKEGKAKYFIEYASRKEFLISSLFTLAAFLFLLKIEGIVLFFISLLPIWVFITYVKKKIDGVTGDTIGATSEIAEVSILFFIIFLRYVHINFFLPS
ncbi:MAG: adenosylcobinamide-GDP ribazoletransferase, partial [Candidatus Desulfofervidus auxilii]|nr:adenosylcobinamide-GDP ribazoletransferase [Candidatus Desulfofervidus auxilii]